MRKKIFFLLALLISILQVKSQVTINFSSIEVNQNGSASVNVSVNNFTDIVGMQFSVNWDSTVIDFTSVTNITTILPDFNGSAIATPNSGPGVGSNQLTVSWFNFSGTAVSLPNNTNLFTINFTAIGDPCDTSLISMTNMPLEIQFIDENIEEIPASQIASNPGTVSINGEDCDDNPPPPAGGLQFYSPMITAEPGSMICVPIRADSFVNLYGGQGVISWNPSVLKYVSFNKGALPSTGINDGQAVTNGTLNFVWFGDGPSGITLPDGTIVYEVCFEVIGALGTMSPLDLVANSDPEWAWTNFDGENVPSSLTDGKITIAEPASGQVDFFISDVMVDKDQTACVDVTANGFIDIVSIQGTFTFDNSVIGFANTTNFNLSGLNATNFNLLAANQLRFQWTSPQTNPVTQPNGTRLFSICFTGLQCDKSSPVNFEDVPNFEIEVIDDNTTAVNFTVDAGSVTVKPCPLTPICSITASSNVTCAGLSNGSITASVTNADAACLCVWTRNGLPFLTLPANNCSLTNIPSGIYVMTVNCANGSCTSTTTITEPLSIGITGQTSHIKCDQLGSIDITVVNGSSPFSYQWQPGGQVTEDVSGLQAGQYTVTVRDANQCSASASFNITVTDPGDITINPVTTDVKCFGENTGALNLNIAGGCEPYTISWSAPSAMGPNPTGLVAATYTVTITDSSNPAKSLTRSFEIKQPSAALSINGTTTPSTGSNGTISTEIKGGTEPYSISWTNGIPSGTFNPTGLAANTYDATVTDANGCTAVKQFVVVDQGGGSNPNISNLVVSTAGTFNGFGTSCNGNCDAAITGTVSGGKAPYTVKIVPTNSVVTLNAVGGFSFEKLCANNYIVTVTDADGKSSSAPISVTQPNTLSSTFTASCTEGGSQNGAVNVNVNGGVPNYVYTWSTGETTQDISGLGVGTYSLTIQDANKCQTFVNNAKIENCNEDCFKAINVITPNSDGANDNFLIDCVNDFPSDLFVYDRWGKLVFTQKNYNNTWQGSDLNGSNLAEGGYMWVLNVENGLGSKQTFKGTVAILRD